MDMICLSSALKCVKTPVICFVVFCTSIPLMFKPREVHKFTLGITDHLCYHIASYHTIHYSLYMSWQAA